MSRCGTSSHANVMLLRLSGPSCEAPPTPELATPNLGKRTRTIHHGLRELADTLHAGTRLFGEHRRVRTRLIIRPMILANDGWYARSLVLTAVGDVAHGLPSKLALKSGVGRGVVLWWCSRRHRSIVVLGLAGSSTQALMLLERIFPRKDRYIVLLEFIPVLGSDNRRRWGEKSSLRARAWTLYQRYILAPVLRRCLINAQCLTRWEVERNARVFRLPVRRFRFVPWYGYSPEDGSSGAFGEPTLAANSESIGVLASGRAACDWDTVFAAADGQRWPLTIVCSRLDLPRVIELNRNGRATVLSEISVDRHDALLRRARVYLIALREANVSSGHVRLNHAAAAGTAVVASLTRSLEDYVQPGETALTFPPGNYVAARAAINRLYDNEDLGRGLVAAARRRGHVWGRQQYMETLQSMVQDAASEVGNGA